MYNWLICDFLMIIMYMYNLFCMIFVYTYCTWATRLCFLFPSSPSPSSLPNLLYCVLATVAPLQILPLLSVNSIPFIELFIALFYVLCVSLPVHTRPLLSYCALTPNRNFTCVHVYMYIYLLHTHTRAFLVLG